MAEIDYKSSLPIRTEVDADSKVHVKICDESTPAQQMTVDTDKNAHVEIHGNMPSGADSVVKLSELGNVNSAGVYDVTNNTLPSTNGLVAFARATTPGASDQTQKITGISNSTVHALDVALHDAAGAAFSELNPLPVLPSEYVGTAVFSESVDTNTASAGTTNHDYTVTALKTLHVKQIIASAAVRSKFYVQIETGAGTGVFTNIMPIYITTSEGFHQLSFAIGMTVAAGVKLRIAKTNNDKSASDLNSMIIGYEV
jgi:hypothetical protein